MFKISYINLNFVLLLQHKCLKLIYYGKPQEEVILFFTFNFIDYFFSSTLLPIGLCDLTIFYLKY